MNITLVMCVYNNLEYTKNCYINIRKKYKEIPLIISSGGSNDGTLEWLQSLEDQYLNFVHETEKISFSDNLNQGINLVETDKLILIHNDMYLSDNFIEKLDKHINKNNIVCYTTIEPPIFNLHERIGKKILNCGSSFNDFNENLFNHYVYNNDVEKIYNGGSFFMSGYKDTFIKNGLFDGFTFSPFFCEDDDFLFRLRLNNINIITISNSYVYHFVSKTSRFSNEYVNNTSLIEKNSNKNFIRKWGFPVHLIYELNLLFNNFNYCRKKIGLISDYNIDILEPFFNKIKTNINFNTYIETEQIYTNYNLKSKFTFFDECDIIITINNETLSKNLINFISKMRFIFNDYSVGIYNYEDIIVQIK